MLHTDRLLLRPWVADDAADLYRFAADPRIGPRAGWQPHRSVAESREAIATVLAGAECYAVVDKQSDALLGSAELRTLDDTTGELGYWIAVPYWGRGLAGEAAAELIRRGTEELGLTCIQAWYHDGNEQSRRVLEKLGLVYERTEGTDPVRHLMALHLQK